MITLTPGSKTSSIGHQTFLESLRVLSEYDETYKVHVAYCLETGSTVTSDRADKLKPMIKELLEDEISFALQNKNLGNLFSNPAPWDVWVKWTEVAETTELDEFDLDVEDPIRGKKQPVATIKIARVAA
jgi:hypothetical protein